MNKKFILSFFAVLFITLNAYSMGSGVQAGIIPGTKGVAGNLTGTVRLMRFPIVFGFGANFGSTSDEIMFGGTGFCDYWIIDTQIHNTVNFYAGPGISVKFLSNTNFDLFFSPGARAIAGVNWLLYDNYIELYFQTGVEPALLIPVKNMSNNSFIVNFPCETGLRVHF